MKLFINAILTLYFTSGLSQEASLMNFTDTLGRKQGIWIEYEEITDLHCAFLASDVNTVIKDYGDVRYYSKIPVKSRGNYLNDLKQGKWKHFKCGQLVQQGSYHQGKKVGLWEENIQEFWPFYKTEKTYSLNGEFHVNSWSGNYEFSVNADSSQITGSFWKMSTPFYLNCERRNCKFTTEKNLELLSFEILDSESFDIWLFSFLLGSYDRDIRRKIYESLINKN